MRINKFVTKQLPILDTVKCNKCGKSVTISDLDPDGYAANIFHAFSIEGEYGSSFDYKKLTFDLCDSCLEKLLKSFKVECDEERLF